MKNSVKDRANGQASCAAQFVANHLGDYVGSWLHVDLAGPAFTAERGTGFGINLLLELLAAGLGSVAVKPFTELIQLWLQGRR